MYIKVINPESSNVNYANTGSSARVNNYLTSKEHFPEEDYSYFNDDGNYTKSQVIDAIDNNIKGLLSEEDYIKRTEAGEKVSLIQYEKFTSIIVSPSTEEIELFRDNPEMEREYISNVMENYAINFNLKKRNGDPIQFNRDDLLWFALRHDERVYKNDDPEVVSGSIAEGSTKPGENMHWHIIVSNRDREMKRTLNPLRCKRTTFDRNQFTYRSVKDFALAYDHKESLRRYLEGVRPYTFKNLTSEEKTGMINDLIDSLNDNFSYKDNPELINEDMLSELDAFKDDNLDTTFYSLQTLSKFDRNSFSLRSRNDFLENFLLELNFSGKVKYYKKKERSQKAAYYYSYIASKYDLQKNINFEFTRSTLGDSFQSFIDLKKDLDKGMVINDVQSYLEDHTIKYLKDELLLTSRSDFDEMPYLGKEKLLQEFFENYSAFYNKPLDIKLINELVEYYTPIDQANLENLNEDTRGYYQDVYSKMHQASKHLMGEHYSGFIQQNSTLAFENYVTGLSKYGKSDFINLLPEEKTEKLKELAGYLNNKYGESLSSDLVLNHQNSIGDSIHDVMVLLKQNLDKTGHYELEPGQGYDIDLRELSEKRFKSINEKLDYIVGNIDKLNQEEFSFRYDKVQEYAKEHEQNDIIKAFLKGVDVKSFSSMEEEVQKNILGDLVTNINDSKEDTINLERIHQIAHEHDISVNAVFLTIKNFPEQYLTEDRIVNSILNFGPKGKETTYIKGDVTPLENLAQYINKEYYQGEPALDKELLSKVAINDPDSDIFQGLLDLKQSFEAGEHIDNAMDFVMERAGEVIKHDILYQPFKDWNAKAGNEHVKLFESYLHKFKEFYGFTSLDPDSVLQQLKPFSKGWLNKASGYILNEYLFAPGINDINTRICDYAVGLSRYGKSDFLRLSSEEQVKKVNDIANYINQKYAVTINEDTIKLLIKKEQNPGEVFSSLFELNEDLSKPDRYKLTETEELPEELVKDLLKLNRIEEPGERLTFIFDNIKEYRDIDLLEYRDKIKLLEANHSWPELTKQYLKSIDIQDFKQLSEPVKAEVNQRLIEEMNKGREHKISFEYIETLIERYGATNEKIFSILKSYPEEYMQETTLVNSMLNFGPAGKQLLYMKNDNGILNNLVDILNREYYTESPIDLKEVQDIADRFPERDVFQSLINVKMLADGGEVPMEPMGFIKEDSAYNLKDELLYIPMHELDALSVEQKNTLILDFVERYQEFYKVDLSLEKLHYVMENLYSGEDKYKDLIGLIRSYTNSGKLSNVDFQESVLDIYGGLSLFSFDSFCSRPHDQKSDFIKHYVEYLNTFYLPEGNKLDKDKVVDLFEDSLGDGVFKGLSKLKFKCSNNIDIIDSFREVEKLSNDYTSQKSSLAFSALDALKGLKRLDLAEHNNFREQFRENRRRRKKQHKY